jgi:hypothetical protein
VGDFDEDGHQDLAVANEYSDDVAILLGNGDVTFQEALFFSADDGPQSVAIGDFNEDGHQDLAIVHNDGDNAAILLGNGDGTFQETSFYYTGRSYSVAIGDFDEDGHQDLAVARYCYIL